MATLYTLYTSFGLLGLGPYSPCKSSAGPIRWCLIIGYARFIPHCGCRGRLRIVRQGSRLGIEAEQGWMHRARKPSRCRTLVGLDTLLHSVALHSALRRKMAPSACSGEDAERMVGGWLLGSKNIDCTNPDSSKLHLESKAAAADTRDLTKKKLVGIIRSGKEQQRYSEQCHRIKSPKSGKWTRTGPRQHTRRRHYAGAGMRCSLSRGVHVPDVGHCVHSTSSFAHHRSPSLTWHRGY